LIGRSSSSREKYACCRIISGFTDRSSEKSTSYQTCIVIGKEGVYLNGIFPHYFNNISVILLLVLLAE
jgi:hypothetical protein